MLLKRHTITVTIRPGSTVRCEVLKLRPRPAGFALVVMRSLDWIEGAGVYDGELIMSSCEVSGTVGIWGYKMEGDWFIYRGSFERVGEVRERRARLGVG